MSHGTYGFGNPYGVKEDQTLQTGFAVQITQPWNPAIGTFNRVIGYTWVRWTLGAALGTFSAPPQTWTDSYGYDILNRQDLGAGTLCWCEPEANATGWVLTPVTGLAAPTQTTPHPPQGNPVVTGDPNYPGGLVAIPQFTLDQTPVNGSPALTIRQFTGDPATSPGIITQLQSNSDGAGTPSIRQYVYPNGTNGSAVSVVRTEGKYTAAGTTLLDATPITTDTAWVIGANGANGVSLPQFVAEICVVWNSDLVSTLKVYPPNSSASLGTLGPGSAYIVEPNEIVIFSRVSALQWDVTAPRSEGIYTAAGSNLGNATPLVSDTAKVTGADGIKGVSLWDEAGEINVVWNTNLSNALLVYPPTASGVIGTLAAGAAYSVPANNIVVFLRVTSTQWAVLSLGGAGGGGTSATNFTIDYYMQVGTSPERWYPATGAIGYSFSTSTVTANQLYAVPFVAPRGGTLDRVGFSLIGTSAGAKARCGIYDSTSSTNLYPNNLIVDSGEFDCSAGGGAGVKSTTISQALTAGKLYWLVFLTNNASITIATMNSANMYPILGISSAFGAPPGVAWTATLTYAALPATFTAGSTIATSGFMPAVAVRFNA
jgi:hypothetical protein